MSQTIPIALLGLKRIEGGSDHYLKGEVDILGCPFHVEAIEVTVDAHGVHSAVDKTYQSWVEDLEQLCGRATCEIIIESRQWLLAITPHGRG